MSNKDPTIRPLKVYLDGDQNYRIKAVGGLHKLKGNKSAYFSLTGTIDRFEASRYGSGRWVDDTGGCIHEEILKHWPELKPVADLHLSDMDGVPMHGAENAWHWMRGACAKVCSSITGRWGPDHTPEKSLEIFANHVRVSLDEATAVRQMVIDAAMAVSQYSRVYEGGAVEPAKKALFDWIDTQRPRWKLEADHAIKAFDLVLYGDI